MMKSAGLVLILTLLLLAAVGVVNCNNEEDLYEILEVAERDDASAKEIKSNFRRLSKMYHPDVAGESSREKYIKIQRAYEILSDRKKRKMYDIRGMDGVKDLEKGGQGQDPSDLLARMFGMNTGQHNNRGENANFVLLVSLADVYTGASHVVTLNKQKVCGKCKGSGADSKADYMKCDKCGGSGQIMRTIQLAPGFVQQMQQTCPKCHGQGKSVKKKCTACQGNRVVRANQRLEVEIEPGMPDNFDIVFEMDADQAPDQIPGDVIFTLQTDSHPYFTRNGNNLEMKLKISLREALLGVERTMKHLDGHEFTIVQKGPIQPGQKVSIEEEGMPKHHVPSEKGMLIVEFAIELPLSLTQQQKETIMEVFAE